MPIDLPEYRIFVSSPNDVPAERARARAVIERLNGEYEGRLRLKPEFWEDKTYGAHTDFQSQIEATANCHLVIGILWNLIGTALDEVRYPRPETGEPYESGTVFEIETALDLLRQNRLPDVALFQKNAPPLTAPSHAEAAELARNLGLMEAIRRRWLQTKTGASKAAFNSFTDPDEFERKFEQHLRAWLVERGHGADGVVWRIRDQDGQDRTPYPGFAAYGAEHAPVFCGRDQVLELCLQDLRAAAQRGCAFLLLLGASGAGKSSLARAGLLPRLNKAGAAPGVDGWREATFRPGQDPLAALARALFAALPELAVTGTPTPAAWCATVRGHAEAAANSVKAALTNAATKATTPRRLKLLLLVDQLEEAFDATPEERAAFAAALAALARGGEAWVLATLRDDRYAGLLEQPLLLAMKRDGATQDLIPPEGAELEAVIREPALRSGLRFERDAEGRDLADELRRAVTSADALPLLQMTLARLFEERDRDSDTMTFRAYREFGGLSGVVDTQAEDVFARADPAAAAELPALLLGLVGGVTEEGRVLAREAPAAVLADTPAREALLALMVEGRLLLTDGREAPDGTRQIWVRVAHEALLRNWTRAQAILQPEALRAKPKVEQWQREWQAGGMRRADLLRGTALEGAQAQALLKAHGAALPEALRDFVTRSAKAGWRQKFWKRNLAGAFALLVLGIWQREQWVELQLANERTETAARLAAEQRERANSEARLTADAAAQRDAALLQQARATAILAEQAIERGDAMTGMLAALSVLPERNERPWSTEAASALRRGVLMNRELAAFTGHTGLVTHAAFSPDGRRLVTASSDRTARLWDLTGERSVATILEGLTGEPVHTVFTPDGRLMVTVSDDRTAQVWDLNRERPVGTILNVAAAIALGVQSVFSQNGRHVDIVIASRNRAVELWNFRGEQPVVTTLGWLEPSDSPRYAAFSANGWLLTASADATRLYDLRRERPVAWILKGHTRAVTHAAFSPDGERLVTASIDGSARVWDLSVWDVGTSQPAVTVLEGRAGWVQHAAFSPDGRRLVTTSTTHMAWLWDLSGERIVGTELAGHRGFLKHASFSPRGEHLVTTSWDGTARLWALSGDRPVATVLGGHKNIVNHAAFSPDGRHLVTASWDGTARLWDLTGERPVANILSGHSDEVRHAAFSPDGRRLVTASDDTTAQLWDLNVAQPVATVLSGHTGWVRHAAFSADGSRLVTASLDRTARVWDVTRARLLTGVRHTGAVTHASFSPDGQHLLTASEDGTARLWDLTGEKPITTFLAEHETPVNHAEISPDGRRLATAPRNENGSVRLWVLSGERTGATILQGHNRQVTRVAFSPDGQRLVTASYDNTARLWELAGKLPVARVLDGHSSLVVYAAFSLDGRHLVTASSDVTARLWNLTGERPVSIVLEGHNGTVTHAAFSPDGRRLVTASADGTARLWDLTGQRPVAIELRPPAGGVTYAAFNPDGQRLVTTSSNGTVRLFEIPTDQELLALARARLTRCLSDAQRDAFGLPPHPSPTADRNQIRPPTEC